MGGNKWERDWDWDWEDAGGGGLGKVVIDLDVDACKEFNSVKAAIAFFVMLACYINKKMLLYKYVNAMYFKANENFKIVYFIW